MSMNAITYPKLLSLQPAIEDPSYATDDSEHDYRDDDRPSRPDHFECVVVVFSTSRREADLALMVVK